SSLRALAYLYYLRGRYAEAEPLYKRALAIEEKAFGPRDSEVGAILNSLAALYDQEGRYADALTLARTATDRGSASRECHLSSLDEARGTELVKATDAVTESFSVIQQASSSAAGAALSKLGARFAAGSGDLARLVRSEQDLAAAGARLNKAVIEEISR